ncbi:hypothetical protein SSTU70S_01500 [Stutzerimonas stutzeri]
MFEQRAVAVAHLADAPAPLAVGLQQEHVVVVEMRTDAATRRGVADHHIVDAPVREKAELPEQLGDLGYQLIDGLDQQRPVTLGQLLVGVLGEWAAAQLPRAVTMLDHQARLDFLLKGKTGQLVRRDGALEIRDGLAYEQRLLLPVVTEELPRAEAAQDLKWNIRSHA